MSGQTTVSCDDLLPLVTTPDAPRLVDLCLEEDHVLDPRLVPASIRLDFRTAASDPALQGDTRIVCICHKGLKLSQGVAALLRAQGFDADALEGGRVEWARCGLPMMAANAHQGAGTRQTHWVMSTENSPDDLLDAWSVVRFLDPDATFLFVEAAQTDLVAERFDVFKSSDMPAFRQTLDGLEAPLGRLSNQLGDTSVRRLLAAHCARTAPSMLRLTEAFVILDALWHDARKVST